MKKILLPMILTGLSFISIYAINTTTAQDSSDTFSQEVLPWLYENKLTHIADVEKFRPQDSITRAEASKFIAKYATIAGLEKQDNSCNFRDTVGFDASLVPSITEACEYGLFRGSNGNFLPKSSITEAQALAVIGRSLYGLQDESGSPWYSEYYAIGEEIGLISSESLSSVDRAYITREKLGTWLYIASQADVDGTENSGDPYNDGPIAYETEVDGPSDCSSYETYDSKRKVCSFECESIQECDDIQSQIDAELDGWSTDLEGQDRDAPESEGESSTTNTKVSYTVQTGEKLKKLTGTDTTEYQSLWKEVADLSPDTLSKTYIETFEIYADPSSDVIAYVSDDDNNGKWKVSINLPTHKLSDEKGQKATIIHELSHIITLNKDQFITPSGKCPNYETQEGCTKSSTYLNAFVKKFWGTATTAKYDASKFITEYATSNPEEDIAESFAFFVLSTNFSDTTIKDQKLNFFNSYPELVEMRTEMRNVLSSEIVRAKKSQK